MKKIYYDESSEIMQLYKSLKIPFTVSMTNNTLVMQTKNTKYYCSTQTLSKQELGFISRVYNSALKKVDEFKDFNEKPDYQTLKDIPVGFYENFIEMDAKKAYWNAAYKMGVISEKLYMEGLDEDKIRKKTRLIALGALATNKVLHDFDGNFFKFIGRETKETANIFFAIAYDVGVAMRSAYNELNKLKKNGCIGFWVDALFLDASLKNEAFEIAKEYGLELKEKPCTMLVERTRAGKIIYVNERKEYNGELTLEAPVFEGEIGTYTDVCSEFKNKPFFLENKTKSERVKFITKNFIRDFQNAEDFKI